MAATAIRESKLLAESQDQLLKLKDDKLAKDLSEKDLLIAEANGKAIEAALALERFKAPRILTDAQRERITKKLKLYLGTA